MPVKIYELKPHHIKFLYGFVLEGEEGIRTDVNSPYPSPFAYLDNPEEKYNPEFIDKLISFCNEFISDKEASLRVVDGGIDDICRLSANCGKRSPSCEGIDYPWCTRIVKDVLGLTPSKRGCYKVSDVVEKMKRVRDAS
jgi:hypothetical protein